MDYAGGTPVHISSGLAAVAYAMVIGKRRDYHENVNTPHNVSFVFLGLALMWFGKYKKIYICSFLIIFLHLYRLVCF